MVTGAPLVAALAVMLISLVGVVFTTGHLGRWLQKNLTYLATFAGGVFILVAWHLAEEAVHEGGWIVGIGAMLVGALLMESINFFFPAHHHHDANHGHAHSTIDGRRVLLSDALHNIGDGILIVAAFSTDFYIGLAATLGVLLHEFVQEISEFFVLREAGYSSTKALSLNFLVSSTILVGLFLALYLSSVEIIVSILAGLAAGGFLSVLLHDLLPHTLASIKQHGGAYIHVATVLVGAGVMFGIQTLVPHEEAAEHVETTATMTISETPSMQQSEAIIAEPASLTVNEGATTKAEATPSTDMATSSATDGTGAAPIPGAR